MKAVIVEREKEIEEKKAIVKNKDVEINELKDSFEKEGEEIRKKVRICKDDHCLVSIISYLLGLILIDIKQFTP